MGRVFDITQLPAWNERRDLEALVARIVAEIGGPSAQQTLMAGGWDPAEEAAEVFTRDKLIEAIARAWMMGANVALNTFEGLRVCRICGCWQLQACQERCAWVAADLCSTCVPVAAQRLGGLTCGRCSRPASSPHFCQAC